MFEFALKAHSGWRYAVLFFALMTAVYALIGMARKQPVHDGAVGIMRIFSIFVDIQFALGVLTLLSRPFYGQLIGHIVLMIGAIAVAHLGFAKLKKSAPENRSYGLMLAASLIPLALMIGGILAIQRAIV